MMLSFPQHEFGFRYLEIRHAKPAHPFVFGKISKISNRGSEKNSLFHVFSNYYFINRFVLNWVHSLGNIHEQTDRSNKFVRFTRKTRKSFAFYVSFTIYEPITLKFDSHSETGSASAVCVGLKT